MAARSTQTTVLLRSVRRAVRKVRNRVGPEGVSTVRRLGEQLSVPDEAVEYAGPDHLRDLRESFRPADDLPLVDGRIPLIWWTDTANYGDLLSPWLVGRVAQRPVAFAPANHASYVAVGSVVTRARKKGSTVWGSGSFGSERRSLFKSSAEYRAVRGPLTRSRLLDVGIDCPRVYGDPALLVPMYFWPDVEKTHEVGIVIRHSEHLWRDVAPDGPVKVIDFGSEDIDTVTRDILACKRIISSSLHGLIIADAYGIPNAWLGADGGQVGGSRPNGGEFKYLDYFASVNKLRRPHYIDLRGAAWSPETLAEHFEYDDRPIEFDHGALLDACPFVVRT
ncbi:MAG: polysaccharide pyruvyl transferase family protein [Marmoricola sp.]